LTMCLAGSRISFLVTILLIFAIMWVGLGPILDHFKKIGDLAEKWAIPRWIPRVCLSTNLLVASALIMLAICWGA
jgi:hypothetical protein